MAIKFLPRDLAADRDRCALPRSARRVALDHPHIFVVHDVGEMEGRPYIATEFVEGETLRERMQPRPLPAARGRRHWHAGRRRARRGARPRPRSSRHQADNMMLRPDGYVKVLDFGLAKLPVQPMRRPSRSRGPIGAVIGTAALHVAGTGARLDLDARSDIWSLGVVLYEMLSGGPPFDGLSSADVLAAVLGADPPLVDDLMLSPFPALARVVEKALRKDRLDRYTDAEEMLADLRRLSSLVARDFGRPDDAAAVRDDEPTLGASENGGG